MADVNTPKWDFNNLEAPAKKAYIKMASDKGFVVDETNGRISEIPAKLEEYLSEFSAVEITGLFVDTVVVSGKSNSFVVASLAEPIVYFKPETLEFEEISQFRINGSLNNFLTDCNVAFVSKFEATLQASALRKLVGTTVNIKVRLNKSGLDKFGVAYGFSSVPSHSVVTVSENAIEIMPMLRSEVEALKLLKEIEVLNNGGEIAIKLP